MLGHPMEYWLRVDKNKLHSLPILLIVILTLSISPKYSFELTNELFETILQRIYPFSNKGAN